MAPFAEGNEQSDLFIREPAEGMNDLNADPQVIAAALAVKIQQMFPPVGSTEGCFEPGYCDEGGK